MARKKRKNKNDAVLDIVIPIFNQVALLRGCLGALADATTVKANVIVVDDGSDEDVRAVVTEVYPEAKYLRMSSNQGFPAAVQRGVGFGSAPFVLLLNSDVTLHPGAINTLLVSFGKQPPPSAVDMPDAKEIGVVAPKLLFSPMSTHGIGGTVQHAGLALDHHLRPFHLFLGWNADHPKVNERRSVQAVSGAVIAFRREVWNAIKKIDEPMSRVYGRGTFEDVEFCIFARYLGYRVVYEPEAVGDHYVGASAEAVGGYDLRRNYEVFKARVGEVAIWDAWYQV